MELSIVILCWELTERSHFFGDRYDERSLSGYCKRSYYQTRSAGFSLIPTDLEVLFCFIYRLICQNVLLQRKTNAWIVWKEMEVVKSGGIVTQSRKRWKKILLFLLIACICIGQQRFDNEKQKIWGRSEKCARRAPKWARGRYKVEVLIERNPFLASQICEWTTSRFSSTMCSPGKPT